MVPPGPERPDPSALAPGFRYEAGRLVVEECDVAGLAEKFGTPLYVYSAGQVRAAYRRVQAAFQPWAPQVHFAVKACSNLSVLRLLVELGAGFDVVSGGEMERCLRAGAAARDLVFAGVGKTAAELDAALERGVGLFNVESGEELEELAARAAAAGTVARVALRVNPDVDAGTHRYITTGREDNKFGLDLPAARVCLQRLGSLPSIDLRGFHVHIGSQVTAAEPFRCAAQAIADLIGEVRATGGKVHLLNLGGGFPARYDRPVIGPKEIAAAVLPVVAPLGVELLVEPGRAVVAEAGILLTRITRVRRRSGKTFAIADAGMNDLLRPTLYEAYHPIEPVLQPNPARPVERVDFVGPICETGDFLGLGRDLTAPAAGDLFAVFAAGAYGAVMASNYNSRPRAAEVLVDGSEARLVRRRETLEDLWGPELVP